MDADIDATGELQNTGEGKAAFTLKFEIEHQWESSSNQNRCTLLLGGERFEWHWFATDNPSLSVTRIKRF